MDYSSINLNTQLRRGIAGEERKYISALKDNIQTEPTPYVHRTAISKGTVQTTLGGLVDFRDATGGTQIFGYDPETGVITINSPISVNGTTNIPNAGTLGTVTITGGMNLQGPGTVVNTSLNFVGGVGIKTLPLNFVATPEVLGLDNPESAKFSNLLTSLGKLPDDSPTEKKIYSQPWPLENIKVEGKTITFTAEGVPGVISIVPQNKYIERPDFLSYKNVEQFFFIPNPIDSFFEEEYAKTLPKVTKPKQEAS